MIIRYNSAIIICEHIILMLTRISITFQSAVLQTKRHTYALRLHYTDKANIRIDGL